MPPTEDVCAPTCEETAPNFASNVQQLADAITAMLRNGIINNANHVVMEPIDPYSGQPVPYLPNLRDLLRRTSGTDDLASITELKLKVVTRDAGLQHLSTHTPHLSELTLDGSVISSLRDLGCRLHSLRVLKVNCCKLKCLDGLNGMRNIEKLYAANNRLSDLTPCTSLELLRHVDVAGNLINDPNTVEFLVLCGTLKDLVLENNPGVSDRPTYREDVRRLIPQLVSLDGVEYAEPPGQPHIVLMRGDTNHNADIQQVNTTTDEVGTASSGNDGCYKVSFAPKVLSPRNEGQSQSNTDA